MNFLATLSFSPQRLFCVMLLGLAAALFPLSSAYADPGLASPIGDTLCLLIGIIYGGAGRALAVLAIIILGVGAMLGKVSWGLALTVGTGIATIFGAPRIFSTLTLSAYTCSFQPGGID